MVSSATSSRSVADTWNQQLMVVVVEIAVGLADDWIVVRGARGGGFVVDTVMAGGVGDAAVGAVDFGHLYLLVLWESKQGCLQNTVCVAVFCQKCDQFVHQAHQHPAEREISAGPRHVAVVDTVVAVVVVIHLG